MSPAVVLLHLLTFRLVVLLALTGALPTRYLHQRERILALEAIMRTGGDLVLNAKEQCVSDVMTAEKAEVIRANRLQGAPFPPAMSFFQAKELIDRSTVFRIIRDMPKGGLLHVHNGATASLDWVISNVTYRPHLYRCFHSDGYMKLDFFHPPPSDTAGQIMWSCLMGSGAVVKALASGALFQELTP